MPVLPVFLRTIHGSLSLYLFITFTDTIRNPLKIGCADGVCSHLKSVLTALSASVSACSEQMTLFNFTEEKSMTWNLMFFFNSILLGVGLAMDAFSVSMANGLNEPCMRGRRMAVIAGVFAGFQFIMPMIGWFCIHTIAQLFHAFEKYIPWIALILLLYIGGKMLMDGLHPESEECGASRVGFVGLMIQGIATSIDALSVGFTIVEYDLLMAFVCSLIIAVVTFVICVAGCCIGKTFGTRLAGKSQILGGCILIVIGLEIFIRGVFL